MTPHRQRGSALLLLLLVGLLLAGLQFSASSRPARELERERRTLLAWSVARNGDSGTGVAESPGELPCPSPYAPGTPQEGQAAPNNCVHGAIGLFPWRQLGSERLLDGWGQPLWYALDNAFKVRRNANEHRRVNSDGRGSLQVYASNGQTQLSPPEEVVALLLAAGPTLPGQVRAPAAAGTLIDRSLMSAHLEGAFGHDNARPGGPFIAGPVYQGGEGLRVNDRVQVVSRGELLAAIAPRLAQAIAQTWSTQLQAHGQYPRPAAPTDPACRDNDATTACRPAATLCRGSLPADLASAPASTSQLPDWFRENQWQRGIYYALGSGPCVTSPLSLGAGAGLPPQAVPALFILPGAPLATQQRNAPLSPDSQTSLRLTDYLESNLRGWDVPDLQQFQRPQPPLSNDLLYTLP